MCVSHQQLRQFVIKEGYIILTDISIHQQLYGFRWSVSRAKKSLMYTDAYDSDTHHPSAIVLDCMLQQNGRKKIQHFDEHVNAVDYRSKRSRLHERLRKFIKLKLLNVPYSSNMDKQNFSWLCTINTIHYNSENESFRLKTILM